MMPSALVDTAAVEGSVHHCHPDSIDDREELLHPARGQEVQPPIVLEHSHAHLLPPFPLLWRSIQAALAGSACCEGALDG